jgi:hypothetical protein
MLVVEAAAFGINLHPNLTSKYVVFGPKKSNSNLRYFKVRQNVVWATYQFDNMSLRQLL